MEEETELNEDLKKAEEGSLIWDEYKYRHDLIWKHLIRSTVAVFALVVVPYSTKLDTDLTLIVAASLLAMGYLCFTFFVIGRELQLYIHIKDLHRKRQHWLYGLHEPDKTEENKGKVKKDGFSQRVRVYLILLFLFTVGACAYNIFDNLTC